jgi:hypothetical protein
MEWKTHTKPAKERKREEIKTRMKEDAKFQLG